MEYIKLNFGEKLGVRDVVVPDNFVENYLKLIEYHVKYQLPYIMCSFGINPDTHKGYQQLLKELKEE